jgi:hypothetical protein
MAVAGRAVFAGDYRRFGPSGPISDQAGLGAIQRGLGSRIGLLPTRSAASMRLRTIAVRGKRGPAAIRQAYLPGVNENVVLYLIAVPVE